MDRSSVTRLAVFRSENSRMEAAGGRAKTRSPAADCNEENFSLGFSTRGKIMIRRVKAETIPRGKRAQTSSIFRSLFFSDSTFPYGSASFISSDAPLLYLRKRKSQFFCEPFFYFFDNRTAFRAKFSGRLFENSHAKSRHVVFGDPAVQREGFF